MNRILSSVLHLSLCLSLILLILPGFAPSKSTELANSAATDAAVLFFEPYNDTELFAYTDDVTHILSTDGMHSCSSVYAGLLGFRRGSTISVICPQEDYMAVQQFDADTLTETNFYGIQIEESNLNLLEIDTFNRVYAVEYDTPNTISIYDSAGSLIGSLDCGEMVQGIQILGDTLFIFLQETCMTVSLDDNLPQVLQPAFSYSTSACPLYMLDETTYIDSTGFIYSTSGNILFDTEQKAIHPNLIKLYGDILYWGTKDAAVFRCDLSDSTLARLELFGTLKAISDTSAILLQDGTFYQVPYDEFIPVELPDPTPSPIPPLPPENPEISIENTYLYASAGTTAATLKSALSPSEIQVYNTAMHTVSGKLRTGWIATIDGTLYTIIVPGDINASGTVNSADLRVLQSLLAENHTVADTQRLAADLNKNGSIDTADLVLCVKQIS